MVCVRVLLRRCWWWWLGGTVRRGCLTVSESGPRCSGSRGFSSVICCSFIPAILDSNLQLPWQQAQNTHTDADNVGYTVVSSGPGSAVFDLKNKQSTLAPLWASHKAIMALESSVGQKGKKSFYMQLFHRLTL